MKNQKEIEEEIEDIVCYEVCCAGQGGISEQTKQIQSLLQSEKKKWKAEVMIAIGEDEEVSPHLPVGRDGFIRGGNKLRHELRERLKKL